MSIEGDLGRLIRDQNPYPNGPAPTTQSIAAAWGNQPAQLGAMDIYFGGPQNENSMEWEPWTANYQYTWEFNETDHKIRKALRIKVRYPVKDSSGNPIIQNGQPIYYNDVLLIGYVGANRGG